jgi:pimeloyl-ACP methyl ester carboxylesterase
MEKKIPWCLWKHSQEAHGLIQDAELKIMAGCGHWPQRDNPEEFNRLMREFLISDS